MASPSLEGGPEGSLPQLPQDPARISKYIQGVVQHNTRESGSRWPPQCTVDQMNSGTHTHPPTPSPGANVQPSPKDSGVDMNSPAHRDDMMHAYPEQEDQMKPDGECPSRRSSAVVDCVGFGPRSVDSVLEGPDLDPGGVGPDLDQIHLDMPILHSSLTATDSFSSNLGDPVHTSQPQNIFEKFLKDKDCASSMSLAELNSSRTQLLDSPTAKYRGLLHTDSVASGLSGLADTSHDLNHSTLSHSTTVSQSEGVLDGQVGTDSTDLALLCTPARDLSQLSSTISSTLRVGTTPPSRTLVQKPSTPSSGLYSRTKSSESLGAIGSNSQDNDLFPIDLLENYQESDDDEEWKQKLERSLSGQVELESGRDTPPVLLPIAPVPPSTPPCSNSSQQGFLGSLSPGFISEFAKFLTQSKIKPVTKTEAQKCGSGAKRRSHSPRGKNSCYTSPGRPAVKRKRCSSIAGSTVSTRETDSDNFMLPVLKLRKLSAGNYAPVPSSSQDSCINPSPKPPRLKIRYGSPEYGGLQVVDVRGQRSSTKDNHADDDEYVLREDAEEYGDMDELQCEEEVADRLSYRTLSPPVLHMEPSLGTGQDEARLVRYGRQLSHTDSLQASSQAACGHCTKSGKPTATDSFNVRTYLNWHSKVIKLRRKVFRLCKLLFPEITFPHKFSREGAQVDTFLDQVISAIKDNGKPPCVEKPWGIPLGDPCCWEVSVVMCKSPKECLQHLRTKITHLLEVMLPDLHLGANFNRRGDIVDELLHHVFTTNKQRLKDQS